VQREGGWGWWTVQRARDEVEEQSRKKGVELKTSAEIILWGWGPVQRERDEVDDQCREKGTRLKNSAMRRGRV
jgi:hypothetical protein